MRGHDVPAVVETHPGLHLAADLAGCAGAVEQRRGDGKIAAVGGDGGPGDGARQADGRAGAAEGADLVVTVEILGPAVADSPDIVAKESIERRDVVGAERPLVALEG